jgi:ADP-ribose pyrophosphatase|nr:MAG TPA: hypothetical protein [Caudoviricetes sp.]
MSKPQLIHLSESYISDYLRLYHSESLVNGNIKKYNFVSKHAGMSQEPNLLSVPYRADAVCIFVYNKNKTKMLLIKEFRYPVNDFIIGTPAGFIDPNETIEQAALRELFEEVGYTKDQVTIDCILEASYSAVGLSDQQVASVFITVDDSVKPKQHLEGTETIQYFWITPHDAEYFLKYKQFNKDIMQQLDLPEKPIGIAARTQLMLKQFTDTLPSESFRALIDQL